MALLFEILVLDFAAMAVCVLGGVCVYFKESFNYWKKRNIPYTKSKFPFGYFGDMSFIKVSILYLFQNIYRELDAEKYGGIYALTKSGFIFREPDIIKNVLVKYFSIFWDRGFFVDEELELLAGHLFLLRGNRWRNLRIKLSPTFTLVK